MQSHVAWHYAVVVEPLHQATQTRVVGMGDAAKRLLLLGIAGHEATIASNLVRAIQLNPQSDPFAGRVHQMTRLIRHMPAGELPEIAIVDLEAAGERREDILRLGIKVRCLAVGETTASHHVELWRRPPWFQHADDAHIGIAQLQRPSHAVGTAKKLVVEVGRDHRHPCVFLIVLRLPAAAVLERHVEHREEIRCRRQHHLHQRRKTRLRRTHLELAVDDQRLPIRTVRSPQIHRRVIVHHVHGVFVAEVGGGVCIHLRIKQHATFTWERITGQQVHHRQRGHAGADADRDGDDHQGRQHLVALQTARCQIQVIAKHSFPSLASPLPEREVGKSRRTRITPNA